MEASEAHARTLIAQRGLPGGAHANSERALGPPRRAGTDRSWPVRAQPSGGEGAGGMLQQLSTLISGNSLAKGDVLAFRPEKPTSAGGLAVGFKLWREGSEVRAGRGWLRGRFWAKMRRALRQGRGR